MCKCLAATFTTASPYSGAKPNSSVICASLQKYYNCRYVSNCGLKSAYGAAPEFKLYVLLVMALANLPSEDIEPEFNALAKEFKKIKGLCRVEHIALAAFNKYFRKYWLQTVGVEGFSVWQTPDRTNNPAEVMNRWCKNRYGCKFGFKKKILTEKRFLLQISFDPPEFVELRFLRIGFFLRPRGTDVLAAANYQGRKF